MVLKKRARARGLLCPVQGKARDGGVPALRRSTEAWVQPPTSRGVLAQWPRSRCRVVWRSHWVGLGPVSLSPCPSFPSAFSKLPVSGVSCPRLGAQGLERYRRVWAPLSLLGVSSSLALALAVASLLSQLSWWLQLPGSADTHPLLSPPTHPSPPQS